MKMKTQNLFPPVEPSPQFREQLKLEVMEVYNQQRRPRFNWRWLVAPSVALASLLLIVLVGNEQSFSQLLGIMQPNQTGVPTQNSPQAQGDENNQPTQLAEKPQNLEQLDQELSELSSTLDTDTDLEAAIAFNNL